MKIILLLVVLALLIILCFFHKKLFVINSSYSVRESKVVDGGRGLFAEKKYKENDIIDLCPTIKIPHDNIYAKSRLNDYVFQSVNDEDHVLVSMGYCGVMNHSQEKQNATWMIDKETESIKMYAIRDIEPDEEFYANYGQEYWDERPYDEN